MRTSFDKAFDIVIGLEGKMTFDPDDPGGFTIWGLSKKYNPEVHIGMTKEQAKPVYLNKYWIPTGCDSAPFPLDICLFDARVNPQNDPDLPGGSMEELINQHPTNWQEYLFLRMVRYSKCSKEKYVHGHLNRILKLFLAIKELERNAS